MQVLFMYLPLLLRYFILEVPVRLIRFFIRLTLYIASFLSVSLLLRTFFKPLKNEYRKDLVTFSIVMGIMVKSVLILASLGILLVVICLEALVFGLIFLGPIYLLYAVFI